MIHADYFQIAFSIKSVLAYLLRFVPEDKQVNVALTSDGERVYLRFAGQTPTMPSETEEPNGGHAIASHARLELALGIETMAALIQQNKGSLIGPLRSGELEEFELTFPVAERGS